MMSAKQSYSVVVRPVAIISPSLLIIAALGFLCRGLGRGILRNHVSQAAKVGPSSLSVASEPS